MKFTITEEEKKSIRGMYLLEQETSGTTPNKDTEIKNLGLSLVDESFKKYGFERNDNPPVTRSMYGYVVTYDRKPFYIGDITEDGNAGVRILVKTTLKDITLQKCNTKTHSLDENYIPLNKMNADCVLGRLTNQITD
jgi:hypothetical protein